jgi:hypothetical protein
LKHSDDGRVAKDNLAQPNPQDETLQGKDKVHTHHEWHGSPQAKGRAGRGQEQIGWPRANSQWKKGEKKGNRQIKRHHPKPHRTK